MNEHTDAWIEGQAENIIPPAPNSGEGIKINKKICTVHYCTLCLKKVTLSNLHQFSHFLHCWKAYEIYYKTNTTLPTSP